MKIYAFTQKFILFRKYLVKNHYEHENIHTLTQEIIQTFQKTNKSCVKLWKIEMYSTEN